MYVNTFLYLCNIKLRAAPFGIFGYKDMMYRAKITSIHAWVENHYNLNAFNFVKDIKDVYIELNDPDEADLLESLNRLERQKMDIILEWHEKYDRG